MRGIIFVAALCIASPVAAGVLAAARTLPIGTVIAPSDLRAIDSDRVGGITDPSQAIGLQTRVTIYEGRPLQPTLLQAPRLVGRNQIVRLTFVRGALQITTEARTLSEGAAGDVIRVMNLDSRNSISAQVQPDGSLLALN